MKIVPFILLSFLSFLCVGQKIDLTGTWHGSSSFLKEHIQFRYELSQKGDEVLGIAVSTNLTKNDSIKVRVGGTIKGNKVFLKGLDLVYKTGATCMANVNLLFSSNGGIELLTGRWKGSPALNTCPPLVSGAISLVKEEPKVQPVVQVEQVKTVTEHTDDQHSRAFEASRVQESDDVGMALVNELGKRRYYALIIGINDYRDEDIQDLDNPIQDAIKLADVLSAHYTFDEAYMQVLKNPEREEIINVLDKLSLKVTEKDHLLIFYAGHGIWNAQLNQGYWLPSDASMDSKSYWLSNSTLRDYVGGIKSKHTLLISDACFSGGILKERAVFENSRAILELYKMPSRKAMTSGTLKTVPDESVFVEYLLKNLVNNQHPLLSADQLFRNFKIAVINNSPNGQVPQYGPITQTGDEGGDFIFLRKE